MVKKDIPSDEELILAAKKYVDKKHIRTENILLYDRIIRRKISDLAFSHMPNRSMWAQELSGGWTIDKLKIEVERYQFLSDLRNKSPNAYAAIVRKGLLEELTSKLKRNQYYRTDRELHNDALLYKSRKEFKIKSPLSHRVACRRGKDFMDKICSHMKRPSVSIPENFLLNNIKSFFPTATKYLETKIKIYDKPYIKSLEIDIFVPELLLGIEYDGDWYHNPEGLIRSHPTWPENDAVNYHEIKDNYFLSKGIKILHIKEKEFNDNRENCVSRCLEFLGVR